MTFYSELPITKDELKEIVYFILMKFRSDSLHLQGTSSKRDLVGGYIERWFNKLAEMKVFDHLLKDKSYDVVCDYFIYANDSDKNAPDILGLKLQGRNIPFVKYNNGTWQNVKEMPRIEVKVVRKDQALLGVRETQMIDDYYVFIESDLECDYITTIFANDIFDDIIFEKLKMSEDFIEADKDSQIIKHSKMTKATRIGSMRLIGIYSKEELRKHTIMCDRKVSPYYFGGVENKDPRGENCDELMSLSPQGLFLYKYDDDYVALPVSIQKKPETIITIKKKNKGSLYVHSTGDISVDGVDVRAGNIKIEYRKFERSSSWKENIVSKHILEKLGRDSTQELLKLFDTIISI